MNESRDSAKRIFELRYRKIFYMDLAEFWASCFFDRSFLSSLINSLVLHKICTVFLNCIYIYAFCFYITF